MLDDAAARAFVATSVALGEDASEALTALPPDPEVAARVATRLELASTDKKQRARATAAALAEIAVAVDRLELAVAADRLELAWPR